MPLGILSSLMPYSLGRVLLDMTSSFALDLDLFLNSSDVVLILRISSKRFRLVILFFSLIIFNLIYSHLHDSINFSLTFFFQLTRKEDKQISFQKISFLNVNNIIYIVILYYIII